MGFLSFRFCSGEDGVGDEELQIEDCLSVNCLSGTETVGDFLMALSQTSALSKQYLTPEDAMHGSHPAYLPDQSRRYGHACSRVRGALIWGTIPMHQTTVFLKVCPF